MENKHINVLIIEDNPGDIKAIKSILSGSNGTTYHLEYADLLSEGLNRLNKNGIDVVLLNPFLQDSKGFDTFINVYENIPEIPILVLSDDNDEGLASLTLQKGAQDYIIKKEIDKKLITRSIQNAIDRQKMLADLRYSSHIDELTGLYNRRGFYNLSRQQLNTFKRHMEEKKIFIFCADVDKFKHINDNYGHQRGDQVLKELSKLLLKTFRDSDVIARLGGDEFVVSAITSNDANEEIITNRFQEQLNKYNESSNMSFELSVSMGAVQYNPDKKETLDELLIRADFLMYENKQKKNMARI